MQQKSYQSLKQLFRFLKEENVYHQFYVNFSNARKPKIGIIEYFNDFDKRSYISSAFLWYSCRYDIDWQKINVKWIKLLDKQNLKRK